MHLEDNLRGWREWAGVTAAVAPDKESRATAAASNFLHADISEVMVLGKCMLVREQRVSKQDTPGEYANIGDVTVQDNYAWIPPQ